MLALLIDENLNQRILRGLRRAVPHLDYVIAQNVGLKGVPDPRLLEWAAAQNRILVTHDLNTIPRHSYERVRNGQAMPGVIAVPDTLSIGQAIEDLTVIVECSQANELESFVLYLPL